MKILAKIYEQEYSYTQYMIIGIQDFALVAEAIGKVRNNIKRHNGEAGEFSQIINSILQVHHTFPMTVELYDYAEEGGEEIDLIEDYQAINPERVITGGSDIRVGAYDIVVGEEAFCIRVFSKHTDQVFESFSIPFKELGL